MTKRTMLIACGAVLAALLGAVLLPRPAGAPVDAAGVHAQDATRPVEPRAGGDGGEPRSGVAPAGAETAVTREAIAPASETGGLLVTVRWHDGTPAADVAISVRAAERGLPATVLLEAISDEAGQVRAAALPAGPVRVRADRGGEEKAEIAPGRLQTCELTLPEGIAVEGIVVDQRDRPVAAAGVWLQTEHTDWTAGRVVARTGADGTFALRQIPPGLSLGALADGFAPSALLDLDTVDTSSAPVAVRLVLEAGGGVVEGVVRDQAGGPVRGATVAVGAYSTGMDYRGRDQWIERWSPRAVQTEGDGSFALAGLAVGTSPVAVRAQGHGFWRGEVALEAGERAWLDVVLGAAVTVSGTVRDARGAPLDGAVVRAYDTMPKTPFVQTGQIDFEEVFGHVATRSDARGRYRLEGVTPGEVHLFAQPQRSSSAGGDGVPFARAVLAAEPGSELVWDPVVDAGRTIEGVVLYSDGHPMGHVFITAKDEQGAAQHVLTNDDEGRFRFVCLEGASYSLHVQLWTPPKGTPPLEKAGIVPATGPVELRAPFPKPVEGPQGEVTGRLDDAGGRVPHEKALQVLLVSSQGWWRTNVEVENGAFRFDGVEAGSYRVVAMVGDTAVAQIDWFDLAAGEVRDAGVLVTEAAGAAVIELERYAETEHLEPTFWLSREGWSRGAQVAMGRRGRVRIDNLTPGRYAVSGFAAGMAPLRGALEVRAGAECTLRLRPQPAVLVPVEVWFPLGRAPGVASMKVEGQDGTVLYESSQTLVAPPRPWKRSLHAPAGTWTVRVTTDTGLAGTGTFEVDALDRPPAAVRMEMR